MREPYDVPPMWPKALADHPDWRAAIAMGIDVFLLEENLKLTPAQRLEQLFAMQALVDEIGGIARPRS